MTTRIKALLLLAAACLLVAGAAAASDTFWHSYAAKFVCGNVGDDGAGAVAADGRYFTAVNIHNPNYLQADMGAPTGAVPVVFYKKIVLALPQFDRRLPPSCFIEEFLGPDEALAVTCKNIKTQLALSGLPSAGFLEGFVVLLVPPFQGTLSETAPDLDVEAIYTARTRARRADVEVNGVSTWDTENVDFKHVRGNPMPELCLTPE